MEHISFSQLKIWNDCPFKHKLVYLDGLKAFQGNLYTAFGSAIHNFAERCFSPVETTPIVDDEALFLKLFEEELGGLPEDILDSLDEKEVNVFLEQGLDIIKEIPNSVVDYFGDCEVLAVEEKIYEPITSYVNKEHNFKGFLDLVVKTSDGKIHIIDWKTCSWGWDARRRSDPMTVYQLMFYKCYYAWKHKVPVDQIDTHFALLKRTAKTGSKIEFFRVTSGTKRVENALKLLEKALYNINNGMHIKNRLSCKRCEFYKTKHCP